MDGFYTVAQTYAGDGNVATGYYTAKELPFYYSLFRNSGLCANYFCSVLGPTGRTASISCPGRRAGSRRTA